MSGVFVGRTDECLEAVAYGKIIDPTGRPAGFHDDEVDFVLFEDSLEVTPLGSGVVEGMNPSFCVKEAAHGIA